MRLGNVYVWVECQSWSREESVASFFTVYRNFSLSLSIDATCFLMLVMLVVRYLWPRPMCQKVWANSRAYFSRHPNTKRRNLFLGSRVLGQKKSLLDSGPEKPLEKHIQVLSTTLEKKFSSTPALFKRWTTSFFLCCYLRLIKHQVAKRASLPLSTLKFSICSSRKSP